MKNRGQLAEIMNRSTDQVPDSVPAGFLADALGSQLGSPCLPVRSYNKDDIICSQGERLVGLYVVKQGEVLLTRLSGDGRETILTLLGPGEFFGEAALVSGFRSNFNAYAVRRTSLLVITPQRFFHLVNDPRVTMKVMEVLVRRCDDAWTQIEAMGCAHVESKVRAVLHWLARRIGVMTTDGIRIDLNQSQLAQMIGCARESLNRQLSSLRRRGLLAIRGRRRHEALYVLRPDELINPA